MIPLVVTKSFACLSGVFLRNDSRQANSRCLKHGNDNLLLNLLVTYHNTAAVFIYQSNAGTNLANRSSPSSPAITLCLIESGMAVKTPGA